MAATSLSKVMLHLTAPVEVVTPLQTVIDPVLKVTVWPAIPFGGTPPVRVADTDPKPRMMPPDPMPNKTGVTAKAVVPLAIAMESGWVAVPAGLAESVASTTKLTVPDGPVGVPVIVPLLANETPAGSDPDARAQV